MFGSYEKDDDDVEDPRRVGVVARASLLIHTHTHTHTLITDLFEKRNEPRPSPLKSSRRRCDDHEEHQTGVKGVLNDYKRAKKMKHLSLNRKDVTRKHF